MKPEKQQLLRDLLRDESSEAATLLAGAHILRRRRQQRVAGRAAGVLLLLGVAGFLFVRLDSARQSVESPTVVSTAPNEPGGPRALSDDELLALFPNTPVALATLSDGKKRLIFPRPGDESRYVTRL